MFALADLFARGLPDAVNDADVIGHILVEDLDPSR